MDAAEIEATLKAGKIGEKPLAELFDIDGHLDLDVPRWLGRSIPKTLAELGATAVRWVPGYNFRVYHTACTHGLSWVGRRARIHDNKWATSPYRKYLTGGHTDTGVAAQQLHARVGQP